MGQRLYFWLEYENHYHVSIKSATQDVTTFELATREPTWITLTRDRADQEVAVQFSAHLGLAHTLAHANPFPLFDA